MAADFTWPGVRIALDGVFAGAATRPLARGIRPAIALRRSVFRGREVLITNE